MNDDQTSQLLKQQVIDFIELKSTLANIRSCIEIMVEYDVPDLYDAIRLHPTGQKVMPTAIDAALVARSRHQTLIKGLHKIVALLSRNAIQEAKQIAIALVSNDDSRQ